MMGVMSELDVIIIHIRAEQAAEYERLFAEHELPRWREYKARGAFLSARISRVAFGTDNRQDVVKYAIAVEVPNHDAHSEHDADPGFQEFNRLATSCSRKTRWCMAERCCTPSDSLERVVQRARADSTSASASANRPSSNARFA
jgi:hypothetical protein